MEAEPDMQVLINTSLTYFKAAASAVAQESDFQSLSQLELKGGRNSSDAVYESLKAGLVDGDLLEKLEKYSDGCFEVDEEFKYSDLYFIQLNFQAVLLIASESQVELVLRFLHLRKKFGNFLVDFGHKPDPGTVLFQNKSSSYLILVRKFTSKLHSLPPQEQPKAKSDCRQQASIYSLKQLPAKLKLVMSISNPLLVKEVKHIGYDCCSLSTCEKTADIFHDSYPFCYHMIDDVDYEVSRTVKIDMDETDLFELASKFTQKTGPLEVSWENSCSLRWDTQAPDQAPEDQSQQPSPEQHPSDAKSAIEGYRLPAVDFHKCIFEVCSFYGKLSMDFKAFDYDWSKPQGERLIRADHLNKMQQKRLLDKKGIPYGKLQELVDRIKAEINSAFFSVELLLDSSLSEVFVVRCRRSADYRRFSGLQSVLEEQLKRLPRAAQQ